MRWLTSFILVVCLLGTRELLGAQEIGGGSASVATGYDLAGLRVAHSDLLASGAWSTNPAGEVNQARGRPVVNDLLGRVTSLDGWNHTYSCDGLLLSSEPASLAEGSRRSVHAYDALGRRVRTTVQAYVGGQWTAFSTTERDFLGRLPLGIETSFAGGGSKSWRFLRGPDVSGTLEGAGGARGVLAVLKDASSWKAVAADTFGNVLALAGTGGDFKRRTFDPWGNPLTRDASGSLRAATLSERRADYDALPLAWASQEVDPDTGLTHYHFREYSPSLGGWLTRDPIGLAGGYLNLRSYLGNRPTDALDVWGEEALTFTAALGAVAAPAAVGALFAVTIQGAVDLYNGERSNAEVYYSVAAGGAAAGVVGRFTGNAFAIGAAYGGTSNLTKQLLDEKRQSIHWDKVADDAAFGAVLGKVGEKLAPFVIAGGRRAGAMLPSEIAAQISAQLSKIESALAKAFAKRQVVAKAAGIPCPDVTNRAGILTRIGEDAWQSSGGLKYVGLDKNGLNRIEHVLQHVDPAVPGKSVFNVPRNQILGLLDEAYGSSGRVPVPGDSAAFVTPMGRTIGTGGENAVRLILKPGTSEVISAYPVKFP